MAAVPTYFEHNSRLDEIMSRVTEIAVLPHVVYKVLELAGSDDASALEIERAIVVDPGFATRILALANSAYMGLPKKVSSIKDAIMFCGVKSVRELAMTVGVYDMFVGKGDKVSLRRRKWWRQSLDTAICAKFIAAKTGSVPQDEAYTCGLIHLIGKTLLCRFGGDDYEQVENLIEAKFDPLDAEWEVYSTNHIELALAAANKWGFPPLIQSGLSYLFPPGADEQFPAHRAAVAISDQIAKYVIDGLQTGPEGNHSLLIPEWCLEVLSISADNIQQVISGGVGAIASAQGFSA